MPKQLNHKEAIVIQLGLFAMALEILLEKRVDYSGDNDPYRNLRTAEAVGAEGWRGVMVRAMDKVSRRRTYLETGGKMKITSEKWADPYFDHINYLCIEAGLGIEELPNREELLALCADKAEQLEQMIHKVRKFAKLDKARKLTEVS